MTFIVHSDIPVLHTHMTNKLGKKQQTTDEIGVILSRPLKIVLPDEQAKNLMLQQAQVLRFTKHTKVFIVPDMIPTFTVQRKGLVAERDRRKGNGEDVVIFKNTVVTRKR